MKSSFCALVVCLFFFSSAAYAACSAEDEQRKAVAFANASQAMAQKDPKKFAAVMDELQAELKALSGSSDREKICQFYDKALSRMK